MDWKIIKNFYDKKYTELMGWIFFNNENIEGLKMKKVLKIIGMVLLAILIILILFY